MKSCVKHNLGFSYEVEPPFYNKKGYKSMKKMINDDNDASFEMYEITLHVKA